MKILFAVKIGDEDWQEQLVTEQEEQVEAASQWARSHGFDRLRIADIDLTKKPWFAGRLRVRAHLKAITGLEEG